MLLFSFSFLFDIKTSYAATVTWDGSDSTSWALGANWVGGSVPADTDDVVIDGNYTNAPTLDLSGGAVTINSLSLGANNSSTLTLSGGDMSTKKFIVTATATIGASGILTHTANTTTQAHVINLEAADLTVAGSINTNYKGYQHSEGPGQGTNGAGDYAGGGGHGGNGGDGINYSASSAGGSAYGSIKQPETIGSGGGDTSTSKFGGAGGGAAKLTVSGTTTVTGNITANGADYTTYSGGGAGGSIYLTTGTLSGAGTVSVNGGKGALINSSQISGDGAGGRIAVYYTTDSSTVTYQAYTGIYTTYTAQIAGAGTIFKKSAAQSNGDLFIDNNDQTNWDDRFIGTTPINETIAFDGITLSNYGNLETGTSSVITYSTLTWSNEGVITDNGGTFDVVSGGGSLTIPATATLKGNTARTFTGLTVEGTLTHSNNATAETYKINYTVNGDASVASGGTINTNYKGYIGGYGPGAGDDSGSYSTGAGHGGAGGDSLDAGSTGGVAYDTLEAPTMIGSGGGDDGGVTGGPSGGGAVKLTVSETLDIDGNITANGGTATNDDGGGASGGSIYLIANTLSGTAALTVNGGAPQDSNSGGGAGGRIAVYYTYIFSAPTATATGAGTTYPGEDGTIYYSYPDHFTLTGSSSQVAGVSQNITLTIIDNNGGTFTAYTGDHAITFSGANNSPSGDTPTAEDKDATAIDFGTATTLTFTAGVATSDMLLYKTEAAEIDATDGTYSTTGDASYDLNVTVSAGTKNKLKWVIQPATPVTAGATWISFTVEITDQYENRTADTDSVTITPSAGSFSGTTIQPAVSGLATFDNISYNTATTITVIGSASGLTSTPVSDSVVINSTSVSYLKITGSTTQIAGIGQVATISAYDEYDNI